MPFLITPKGAAGCRKLTGTRADSSSVSAEALGPLPPPEDVELGGAGKEMGAITDVGMKNRVKGAPISGTNVSLVMMVPFLTMMSPVGTGSLPTLTSMIPL